MKFAETCGQENKNLDQLFCLVPSFLYCTMVARLQNRLLSTG